MPSVLLRIPNTQLIWDQTWQWKNIYQNSAAKAQQNYAIKTWKPEISVFFYRTFASSWWHIEKIAHLLQESTGSTKKTSINVCNLNLNCISKLSGEIRQRSPVLGSIPCDHPFLTIPGGCFWGFFGDPWGITSPSRCSQRDPALRMRQPRPQALLNFHQLQHAHPAACGKSWEKYPRNP